jgi:hypothetical protein
VVLVKMDLEVHLQVALSQVQVVVKVDHSIKTEAQVDLGAEVEEPSVDLDQVVEVTLQVYHLLKEHLVETDQTQTEMELGEVAVVLLIQVVTTDQTIEKLVTEETEQQLLSQDHLLLMAEVELQVYNQEDLETVEQAEEQVLEDQVQQILVAEAVASMDLVVAES